MFRAVKKAIDAGLAPEDALRAMTLTPAEIYGVQDRLGSIEKGKFADFVILDTDLMKCAEKEILKTKVLETFLNGESVYKK